MLYAAKVFRNCRPVATLTFLKGIGRLSASLIRHVTFYTRVRDLGREMPQTLEREVEDLRLALRRLPDLGKVQLTIDLHCDVVSISDGEVREREEQIRECISAIKSLCELHPNLKKVVRRWPRAKQHVYFLLASSSYRVTRWEKLLDVGVRAKDSLPIEMSRLSTAGHEVEG